MKKFFTVLMVVCLMLVSITNVSAKTYTETRTISANTFAEWSKAVSSPSFKSLPISNDPVSYRITKIVPKTYKTFDVPVPGVGPGAPTVTKKQQLPVSFTFTIHKHEWKTKAIWYGNYIVYGSVCSECGVEKGNAQYWEMPSW